MTAPQEMTKEKIADLIRRLRNRAGNYPIPRDTIFQEAADALASLSADRVSGWVKCSERLPEISDEYLVFFQEKMTTLPFNGERWTWDNGEFMSTGLQPQVTHWQPLPSAPQPTEDSNER